MKAKKIHETQSFKRGEDPYNKLNIGKYDNDYDFDNSQEGDQIELMEDIYYYFTDDSLTTMKVLMNNISIKFKRGTIFTFTLYNKSGWWINIEKEELSYKWVDDNKKSFKKIRK